MDENISIKQLVSEGKSAYQLGDFLAAARAFDAAAQAYSATGDALNAAEMSNNSSVAYLQAGEAQEAFKSVEGTPTTFARAGDLRRQGISLGNLGAALEAMGRLDEAIEVYQQSAELLQSAGENDLRAYVMKSLSALHLRTGRHIAAIAAMESGLEGIPHPKPQQRLLKKILSAPLKLLGRSSDRS
jgi:tetratricopeptide (TPR) repeat protein